MTTLTTDKTQRTTEDDRTIVSTTSTDDMTSDEIVTTTYIPTQDHVTTDTVRIVILLQPSLPGARHCYSRNLLIINMAGGRKNEKEDDTLRIDMMRGIIPRNQSRLLNPRLRSWLLVTYLTLLEEIRGQRG
jgi:hypothetical protein